jgi:hypothetical protein
MGVKFYFGFDVVEHAGSGIPFENLPARTRLQPAPLNRRIEQRDEREIVDDNMGGLNIYIASPI